MKAGSEAPSTASPAIATGQPDFTIARGEGASHRAARDYDRLVGGAALARANPLRVTAADVAVGASAPAWFTRDPSAVTGPAGPRGSRLPVRAMTCWPPGAVADFNILFVRCRGTHPVLPRESPQPALLSALPRSRFPTFLASQPGGSGGGTFFPLDGASTNAIIKH